MEQNNQKMEQFGFVYITKEEQDVKLPQDSKIIRIDTLNGVPTIFYRAAADAKKDTKTIHVKLVGPQDMYDAEMYQYIGTIKAITQARIMMDATELNLQETPLHMLICKSENVEE